MSGPTWLSLNVVARAHVHGGGRALGARDDAALQLRRAGSAGAGGSHDGSRRPRYDEEEEAPAAAPLETDLEKYLKLPQLPLTMPDGTPTDILAWWKLRDHSLPADPQSGRPGGILEGFREIQGQGVEIS